LACVSFYHEVSVRTLWLSFIGCKAGGNWP
jgi:hypothetical protein